WSRGANHRSHSRNNAGNANRTHSRPEWSAIVEQYAAAYFRASKNSDNFVPSGTWVSIFSKLPIKYTTANGIPIPTIQSRNKMIPLPCHSYRVTLSIFFYVGFCVSGDVDIRCSVMVCA